MPQLLRFGSYDVTQTKENASDVRQSDEGVLIVRRGVITKQMRYYT